jgi:hypothetical protein
MTVRNPASAPLYIKSLDPSTLGYMPSRGIQRVEVEQWLRSLGAGTEVKLLTE